MASFRSPLVFEDDDGLPYVLTQALVYQSDLLRCTVTVPAGFKTDLASIPRILWNILPKSARYDRAAVIHDALYAWGMTGPTPLDQVIERRDADAVLYEAMAALGVGGLTRRLIYHGVRFGGGIPWRRYRAQRLEVV